MIHDILKMGDPRLLRIAPPVPDAMLGSAELDALIADMFDTMHAADGVGLAAPQIGIDLQLVIFGFDSNERYPDAPAVPRTILLNPVITPLSQDMEEGWEGCLSVPGMRGLLADSLRGRRPAWCAYRSHSRGLPCPCGTARVRPPDRPVVSHAHYRLQQVRLHRGAVSGAGHGRG